MATHTGGAIAEILYDDTLEFCSSTIIDKTPTVISVCDVDDSSSFGAGVLASNLPVEMLERESDGYRAITFLDDYYYRIHLVPNSYELGPILTDLERDFIVWNAYFEPVTCDDITSEGAIDLTLEGLTPPFNIPALGHKDYTIDIPLDGSPIVDASYTFDFGDDGLYSITITGTRITLFVFRPQESLTETLEWFTNILSPRYGITAEQRIALRKVPRQAFNFSVLLSDEILQARFDTLIFKGQRRFWGIPIWAEMVEHTAVISADAMTIDLDTTNADFRDDSMAVIWSSPVLCEVIEIASVTPTSLVLNSPVVGNYSGTKLIMPLRLAKMNEVVQRHNYAPGMAVFDVSFLIQDNASVTGYTPTQTYKSLPVVLTATPVESVQDKSSDTEFETVDYQVGPFNLLMDNAHNKLTQSHHFYNDTKLECWVFRQFLHSLFGRQGCVWIPTFKPDLALTETIAPSDTSFRISNIQLTEGMGLNTLRTNLAFVFPDGTVLCREITGIVVADETEEIVSIDSALGITVNPGDCVISFLDKCRLSSDKAEITWLMAHQNECALNFTVVKE